MTQVRLGELAIGNSCPMVLLGGVNVLEDEAFALHCAAHYQSAPVLAFRWSSRPPMTRPIAPRSTPIGDLVCQRDCASFRRSRTAAASL